MGGQWCGSDAFLTETGLLTFLENVRNMVTRPRIFNVLTTLNGVSEIMWAGQPLSPCSTEGVPGRVLDCKASVVLCIRHVGEQLGGLSAVAQQSLDWQG